MGPIEDCCVMLLLRFPPARKCLVGTFESFLCGFGEFCSNLHRSDSEGATEWYQSQVSILGPVGYGPTTLPLQHPQNRTYASLSKIRQTRIETIQRCPPGTFVRVENEVITLHNSPRWDPQNRYI